MKTSLCTGEPRHGTEGARRENRAAKETDRNTGQDTETQRQARKQRGTREGKTCTESGSVCGLVFTCATSARASAHMCACANAIHGWLDMNLFSGASQFPSANRL